MKTKNRLISFLLVIGVLLTLGSMSALATTYRSAGTGGNWNAMATWEYDNSGVWTAADASHQYPSLGDVATITTGTTVTGNATVSLATLTVQANAILNTNYSTTVSGTLTIASSGTMSTSAALSATTITNSGTLTVGGDVSVTTITVNGTMKPDGGLRTVTVAGSMTAGASSAVEFINTTGGTGRLSWTFTGTGTIDNDANSTSATNLKMYNLNVSATGVVTLAANTAIYVMGDLVVTNGSFDGSTNDTKIFFDNALTGASKNLTNTGGTLKLGQLEVTTGSTVNSASYSGIEINRNIVIASGAIYNINYPQAVTLKGASSPQTITANGSFNLNGSGLTLAELWIDNVTGSEVKLATNLTGINGNFYVKSSGAAAGLNLQGYSISGTGNFTAQSGSYLKINNNNSTYGGVYEAIKVTGNRIFADDVNYTFAGGKTGFTNAKKSGATESSITVVNDIYIGGTVTTAETFTIADDLEVEALKSFTATAGEITFSGAATTINANTTGSLTLYDIEVTGAGVVESANTTITLKHDLTVASTGSFTPAAAATSDIVFNGTTTITNAGTLTPGDWDITGNGAVTLGSALTVTGGTLTLNSATASLNTSTYVITGAGAEVALTAGTFKTSHAGGVAGCLPAGSTYTTQTVSFEFNGSPTTLGLNLTAPIVDILNLTINSTGAAATLPTNALTVRGNIAVNGTASFAPDALVTMNNTVAKTITKASGATLTFAAGLTIATGSSVTTTSDFTVSGAALTTVGTGSFVASSPSTITLNLGGATPVNTGNTGVITFYNLTNLAAAAPATDFTVAGDFLNTSGALAATAGTMTMSGTGKTIKVTAGSVALAELDITGSITQYNTITAETFTCSGTFTYSGTPVFNLLEISGTPTVNATGTVTFYDLTASPTTATVFGASVFNVAHNLDAGAAGLDLAGNTSTVNMTGASGSIITGAAPARFYNLNIKTGATITQAGSGDLTVLPGGLYTVENGAKLILPAVAPAITGGGDLTFASGSTVSVSDAGGFATTIDGAVLGTVTSAGVNVELAATVTDAGLDVNGQSIVSVGNFTSAATALADLSANVTISGNLTNEVGGVFATAATERITMSGTDKEIINNGTSIDLGLLTIDGTISTAADIEMIGTGAGVITVNSGKSFTATAGTILLTGAAPTIVNSAATSSALSFNNLTLGDGADAIATASSFTINGNVTMGNAGATFVASTPSTVTLAGTGIITSLANQFTFWNLSVTGSYTIASNWGLTVNGPSFNVSGSFRGYNIGTSTYEGSLSMRNAAGVITNTGTLIFNNLRIDDAASGGRHITTASSFSVYTSIICGSATSSFEATAGTISLIGSGTLTPLANYVANTSGFRFNNLEVSGTHTYTGGFVIAHYGNVSVTSSGKYEPAVAGTGLATFYGATNKTITNAGTLTFVDFTINGTAGNNVTTASNFNIEDDLHVQAGATFVATAGTISFITGSGDGHLLINDGSSAAALTLFNLTLSNAAQNLDLSGSMKEIYIKGNISNTLAGTMNLDAAANGKVYLNGTTEQNITVSTGAGAIEFDNLDISNASGVRLNGDIAVDKLKVYETLRLNNGDIDLNGNNILTIDAAGKLQETPGNVVKNSGAATSTGNVQITVAGGSALQNENLGGLGMQITTAVAPGSTTIKRYHIPQALGGSSSGYQTISRYYEVSTTTTTGLNAQVIMKYDDSELNGNNKSALNIVTTSVDPSLTTNETWLSRSGVVADATNNMLLIAGLDGFLTTNKYWSAGYAPALTMTQLKKGLVAEGASTGTLTAGRTSQGIYGVKLTSTGTMEVSSLKFNFYGATAVARTLAAGNPEFRGFALVRSDDDVYSSDDAVILSNLDEVANTKITPTDISGFPGQSSITFDLSAASDKQTITSDAAKYYFLVANVNNTSNITSALTALQVYMTQADVTADGGLVTSAEVTGTRYSFQPGLYFTWIPDGTATSPLTASSTNNGIMGFSVKGTNTATLGGFSVDFNADPTEKVESFKVYRSSDREFSPSTDAEVTSYVTWSTDKKTAQVTFGTESAASAENVLTTDKYYFLAVNTKAGVNGATEVMTPSFDNTKIISTTAGYTPAQQILTAPTYEFGILAANVTTTNMTPAKNIGKGIVNQPVYAFAIEPTTTNNVTFTALTVNATFANAATNGHFTSYKLWYDANGDGYPQSTETNWNGTYSGTSTEGTITFSGITSQTFSAARKYIITCNVLSTATSDGTLTLQLKNQNYVTLTSPAIVNDFTALNGNTQTVKTPGTISKIAIVGYSTSVVNTGEAVQITVQQQDASSTPVNATAINALTAGAPNNCTLGGTTTANITVGSDVATFTNITLTNASGTSTATFVVTDGSGRTATTSNFKIYPTAPTAQATLTLTGNTARTVKSLSIDTWSAGTGGAGRIFVMREGYPPVAPTDGIEYVANTDISLCGNVGTGQTGPGSFVVYNELGAATSTPFTVSNLTAGKRYYIAVYEYTGSSSLTKYVQTMSSVTAPINVKYDTTLSGTTTDPYGTHNDWGLAAFIATDCDVYGTVADTGIARTGSYYSFNVPSTSRNNLLIRLSNLPANYNITLYNGSRRFLREAANSSTTDEVIVINAANPGKYFLKVTGSDSTQTSASPFKLRVSTSATEVMSPEE